MEHTPQVVFVVMEPVYRANHIYAVTATLELAGAAIREAMDINPSNFQGPRKSAWFNREHRLDNRMEKVWFHRLYLDGGPTDWVIEEQPVRQ